jgi:hypothetical protein
MTLPKPKPKKMDVKAIYMTNSQSSDAVHFTFVDQFDDVKCTCIGFRTHEHCWHADEVFAKECVG